jgi:hypothetical protein
MKIIASDGDGNRFVLKDLNSFNYEISHIQAAIGLCEKTKWDTPKACGWFKKECFHI